MYLWNLIFIGIWLNMRSPNRHTLGMSLREFPEKFNWRGKNPPWIWALPSHGVGSFNEYKKKASQGNTSTLCSEMKSQGWELLLPSLLSHCDGWQPQPTSPHFLAEDTSWPVHVTGERKVTTAVLYGESPDISVGNPTKSVFLVLPQKLITGRCGPHVRERQELMVTQTNSRILSRLFFVSLNSSPFSDARFTLSLKLFWFSLLCPAAVCWRRGGWWEGTHWAVTLFTNS